MWDTRTSCVTNANLSGLTRDGTPKVRLLEKMATGFWSSAPYLETPGFSKLTLNDPDLLIPG